MESLRKKYKRGEIDQKTYREKVTELTILHLESIDYKYIGKIADGTHGVVVELKSPNSALKVAVKIVIDELVTDGEVNIWSKLVNEHILPLIKWRDIAETNTKAFFTQKHPSTLEDKLKQSSFLSKSNGFENAVACIKDITNGINFLHKEGLCHLNLQTDHILLKANNRARICSFGYLTSKDAKEFKYGSPAIFRPPEAYQTNDKIDGQKFDIWSLGILATEIFTGQYLTNLISKRNIEPTNWYYELYGTIFDVLEETKFKELMKNTFKNSVDIDLNIDQARNFITSCLILNSEDRPSAENLLKHQLIGGEIEKCCPTQYVDIWGEKTNPINLLMLKLEYGNQSFSEYYANSSEDETEKVNGVELDESGGKDVENPHITDDEIPKESMKTIDKLECEKFVCANPLETSKENECAVDQIVQIEKNKETEIFPAVLNEEILENQISLVTEVENEKPCNSLGETVDIQNDVKVENSCTIHISKDTTVGKYEDDFVDKIDSVTLHTVSDEDETAMINRKKDESKENLDTAEINRVEIIKHDDDTSLNDTSKDVGESHCEEILNLQKSEINEFFCNPDLVNDNKIKTDETEAKVYPIDYVSASKNDGHFDTEKLDFIKKDVDPSLDEKINDITKKENDINTSALDIKNEMHIDQDNIKQEEESLKESSSTVYDSSASSLKTLHCTDKSRRKKRRKKCPSENYDQIKNSPTHTIKYLYEQSDRVNDNQENAFKNNRYKQNSTKITETSSSSSLISVKPKQNTFEQNTQQSTRKVNLYRKTLEKQKTKHSHKNDEQFSSDISSRQTSRKTDLRRRKIKKVSPSTSSVQTVKNDDDEDEDEIEPGEIPLFRKKYKNILDHVGSDYSVTSLSVFDASYDEDFEEGEVDLNKQGSIKGSFNDYSVALLSVSGSSDEDLEEGEDDPNNRGSINDSSPIQGRKRFRKIRSWWKRQKHNLSNIFKACIPISVNKV